MKEYSVNLEGVKAWPEFIAAFNRDFIKHFGDSEWHGNLDALNDYLSWPEEDSYRLIMHGWISCFPFVNQHQTWDNKPILTEVIEIFQDNAHIEVVLK